jgi:hypothetical protein
MYKKSFSRQGRKAFEAEIALSSMGSEFDGFILSSGRIAGGRSRAFVMTANLRA